MKKTITLVAATLVVASLMSVTAFAHGGHHRGGGTKYGLCNVANCTTAGNHWHNGSIYSGHYAGDGHWGWHH